MTYRPRELSRQLADALESLPVVVLTGMRQVGKTTFLRRDPALQGRRYYTLDDFATLEAARRDPDSLLEGTDPVTIDEAQRCPELLPAVKRAVDRDRKPGRVVLSGSANFGLLRSVSESLAGRALYLSLHPFNRRELRGRLDTVPLLLRLLDGETPPKVPSAQPLREEEILLGGMPPVVLGEAKQPYLWFTGYEQTYIERDVRELAQVGDLVTFRTFVRLCALRTAQVLNQSALARDAKVSSATAGRYLGLLEASYIAWRLPPFLRSRTSRLVKSPKLFIGDSGLACFLAGVRDLKPTADERMRGALFETLVAQNLAAIVGTHRPDTELGFWHVQGRHEVDFVVATAKHSLAIEVKAAARFSDADLASLRAFAERTPRVRTLVLAYNGTETVSLGQSTYAVPLSALLS